ncbi:MAG TPA: hypothetical protein VM869_26650, partial [Enhygromyxa sp.]|nr:hypothetical protein [Enhygromyxa sp.]
MRLDLMLRHAHFMVDVGGVPADRDDARERVRVGEQWRERWMIFTRRGIDIDAYPAIEAHLSRYR